MVLDKTEGALLTELTAFYANTKKTASTPINPREFHSLTYRYGGKITLEAGGEQLISEAGCVTFMPKGVAYRTAILESGRMAVIHFKLDKDIDFRNPAVIKVSDAAVPRLFERLIQNFHIDTPMDFRTMSIFYELLATLNEGYRGGVQVSDTIGRIRGYIGQHYSDPGLYVGSLAARFGISTSYLRREFCRAFGMPPVTFLRTVRIGNAKSMLESGYLPISEIAEQCGFSSTGYFIQAFHQFVGVSPDRYRRRFLGK